MKRKQPKLKEVEKANSEIENPKNIDFVEISMSHEELDKLAQKNAQLLSQRTDPTIRKHMVRRQEKLIRKVFKAASQILNDEQFNIFTMRYIYNMPENEIATQIGKHQTHIPRTLKTSIMKIQKQLRIPPNLLGFSRDRKDKHEKE
jgi:RNA polymerase sigma factor (sigma-70 family)